MREHPQQARHLLLVFAGLYPLQSIHRGLTGCAWNISRGLPREWSVKPSSRNLEQTHPKEVDVVQDLIVEGEIIAGNDVDTSFLLQLPMFKTQSLALAQQLFLGDLSCPECFRCFLQVTIHPHARKTED